MAGAGKRQHWQSRKRELQIGTRPRALLEHPVNGGAQQPCIPKTPAQDSCIAKSWYLQHCHGTYINLVPSFQPNTCDASTLRKVAAGAGHLGEAISAPGQHAVVVVVPAQQRHLYPLRLRRARPRGSTQQQLFLRIAGSQQGGTTSCWFEKKRT